LHRIWKFVIEYSLLLLTGAVVALLWANVDYDSYHKIIDGVLWVNPYIGQLKDGARVLTLHYLINDVLMALFFAIAGKEVWEAVALKSGGLRGRNAVTPLVATAGGMIGPAGLYLLGAWFVGKYGALANGWAIPTATDIAFSYLVGRVVFGARHPAVLFLLLLAIVDDATGLVIIAVFYPKTAVNPEWLLLSAAAGVAVYLLFNLLPRRLDERNGDCRATRWVRHTLSFWPYAIAGCVSWYGFQSAGLHPALGLLPVVPAIPHADISFGFFAEEEHERHTDLLNTMEHGLRVPVEIVLLFFGLANAGVPVSAVGTATWLVLLGLMVGKPFGVWLFGLFSARALRFGMPPGVESRDMFLIGAISGIGFTVSLFVAAVAFPPGTDEQQAARMGALLSFAMAPLAILIARMLGVKPQRAETG